MLGKWATRTAWGLVAAVLFASRSPAPEDIVAAEAERSAKRRGSRARWDDYYSGIDLDSDRWRPNAVLVHTVRELEPGRALDVGAGQGRNSLYLAEQGWRVTAIDISSVAIDLIDEQARERGLELETRRVNVSLFDFGSERWDLIVCSYMHETCLDQADDMIASLAPGGLLLIEGFLAGKEVAAIGRDRLGFEPDALPGPFSSLEVLRHDQVRKYGDWYPQHVLPIVQFVARKP